VKENTVFTPGLLVVDQFKFMSAPRMMGMSNAKSSFFTVTLRRSPRLTPIATSKASTAGCVMNA
jgi:hypothetical protein